MQMRTDGLNDIHIQHACVICTANKMNYKFFTFPEKRWIYTLYIYTVCIVFTLIDLQKPTGITLITSISPGVCRALQPHAVWAHSRDSGTEKTAVWQAAAACHVWEAKLHNSPGGLFRDGRAQSPACWKRQHHQRKFLWDTTLLLSCKMCFT